MRPAPSPDRLLSHVSLGPTLGPLLVDTVDMAVQSLSRRALRTLTPSEPTADKTGVQPWLVRLRGLSTCLRTQGSQFDSQSGHRSGLWAGSPVGGK